MDRKQIKKLANNPNFIPGIYNYCDRWCERCTFTSRCLNYAFSEEHFSNSEACDLENKLFWQKLTEIFQLTLDMLKETAEREGIDLESLDLKATAEEERLKEETVRNHECSRAAKAYGKMVETWLDSASYLFQEKEGELNLKMRLEIPNVNPVGEATRIKNAVDIIRWYHHQIYIKLMRAVEGKLEEKSEILDEYPKDCDGSAKVALVAIDRSIAAWGEMRLHFPEREGEILNLLVHLNRLCKRVEKTFPAARAFARPGFDKIELYG